jgi:hypothetical protein
LWWSFFWGYVQHNHSIWTCHMMDFQSYFISSITCRSSSPAVAVERGMHWYIEEFICTGSWFLKFLLQNYAIS